MMIQSSDLTGLTDLSRQWDSVMSLSFQWDVWQRQFQQSDRSTVQMLFFYQRAEYIGHISGKVWAGTSCQISEGSFVSKPWHLADQAYDFNFEIWIHNSEIWLNHILPTTSSCDRLNDLQRGQSLIKMKINFHLWYKAFTAASLFYNSAEDLLEWLNKCVDWWGLCFCADSRRKQGHQKDCHFKKYWSLHSISCLT